MTGWELPREAVIGGNTYHIHSDYRDILDIFSRLQDETLPEFIRWKVALALFYEEQIPEEDFSEAARYFCRFINCGQEETEHPGPPLIDWEADAQVIVSDVNKAAGKEIRELPYLHWWTFLGYFRAIGEGPFATLVAIRDKRRRGAKLLPHEQEFARTHASLLKLPTPDTEEKRRLEALLNGQWTM